MTVAAAAIVPAGTLVAEPFLHYGPDRIYNTLTDQLLSADDPGFQ